MGRLMSAQRKPKLSARAEALFKRIHAGEWYPAWDSNTPKAMQELIDADLVRIGARVQTVVSCYVPLKGFKPFKHEKWAHDRRIIWGPV